MNIRIASLAASAAFLAITPAFAADMPIEQPMAAVAPVEQAALDWTGFYVGVHGGYGWGAFGEDDDFFGVDEDEFDVEGAIAGGQIGYNMQFGQWVAGVEGDASWTDLSDEDDDDLVEVEGELEWLSTIRGRVGYSFDSVLLYGTGGVAFGDVQIGDEDEDDSNTQVGFAVGGGVEVAVTENVSIKGEYLYVDLGEESFDLDEGAEPADIDFQAHTIKAGLNFRF